MKNLSYRECMDEFSQHGRFVNLYQLWDYNRPYMFCGIDRGAGKTTQAAGIALARNIYYGNEFIYTRRNRDETLLTCPEFFDDAAAILSDILKKNISVSYKAGIYTAKIDGEERQIGRIVPLSMEYKYKSLSPLFSKTTLIIYDEFLTDPRKGQSYLGGTARPDAECRAMISLFRTVDRKRGSVFRNETRVLFLGNTATIYNPFYLKYGISDELQRNPNAIIIAPKNAGWVLYQPDVPAAHDGYDGSYVSMIEDDEDRAYGKAGIDSKTFIGENADATTPLLNVIIQGTKYGVYVSNGFENIQIKEKPSSFVKTISVDLLGHDGKMDFAMVKQWQSVSELSFISQAFLAGRVMFSNGRCKNAWLHYLNYMPN